MQLNTSKTKEMIFGCIAKTGPVLTTPIGRHHGNDAVLIC